MDIASRIQNHEYREGDRLFGRSSLAGLYKVSPETIRRAVALLHSRGVVAAMAGSGVVILSEDAATKYLEESRLSSVLRGLEEEIAALIAERRRLDQRLEEAIDKVVHYTTGAITTMRHVEEIVIPQHSFLVGQSLLSADLRTKIGITVIGIVRGKEELFSPPADTELKASDVLIVVGSPVAKESLKRYVDLKDGDEPRD